MSENQQVEWKETWRDEFLKWICGFANAQGGVLEIGRNDKGKAVGVGDPKKLMEDLPNKMRDALGIIADVDRFEEDGKTLVRITVEPYPYPVSYKGEYHIRSGSTKQVLKGAALHHFLLRKTGKRWDSVPQPGVLVSDLDPAAIQRFRDRAAAKKRIRTELLKISDEALIEKLHLTDGEFLKRAGVLLFHPEPEQFYTGASVRIGYFESPRDVIFHDEVGGDLFTQIDRTMELLTTKYLRASISYEGVQRVERLPVPENALRETLHNAIAHKDYSSGVPVQIKVYPDRVLFWNNGKLPDGWTVERLMQEHPSKAFNPDIAKVLFQAGLIETWGRGYEEIKEACAEHGLAPPDLRYEEVGLSVEYDMVNQVGTKLALSRHQAEILRKASKESSLVELMEVVGRSDRTKFRNQVLKPLITFGLIEMTIPDKPTSSRQKYRTTPLGEQVLSTPQGEGR